MRRLVVLLVTIAAAAAIWSANAAADPVIAAAGDIACGPATSSFNGGLGTASSCRQKYTSDLLVGANLVGVLALGDNQYECGGKSAFLQSFDPSWGRVKSLIHPTVGNHEYLTSGGTDCDLTGKARGYFDYFGAAAGNATKGYYSYDIGAWHVIALNSNCSKVGGCSAGSPQETWLRSDLSAHRNACTLAYWHHPRFSSGSHGSDAASADFWGDLYNAGADIVLSAHDHDYERFTPQNASGAADPFYGIREFVVGTGGKSHYSLLTTRPNSAVRNSDTFGVLKLTLHAMSYDWQFVPEAGKSFTDAGTGSCHGAPAAATTTLTFPAGADARVLEATPTTNYATSYLRADGGTDPDVESYIRFTVTGLSGTVTSAKLRLYAFNPSNNGPAVYSTTNSWTETGINWSNRPARTSPATDDKGAVALNTWVEYDVKPFVTGNGTYSFVLATSSADAVDFNQREAASLRPELVIVTG
jgi:calcineurin-like phosphoesterase family protein